jgi:hypothetical protein
VTPAPLLSAGCWQRYKKIKKEKQTARNEKNKEKYTN